MSAFSAAMDGIRRVNRAPAILIGELTEGRRQMVLTTTQPLEELEGLDGRLLARLGGGLSVIFSDTHQFER